MESLPLEQVKLPWMEVSREAYHDWGVCDGTLKVYMEDADKWNPGFEKFNVS